MVYKADIKKCNQLSPVNLKKMHNIGIKVKGINITHINKDNILQ